MLFAAESGEASHCSRVASVNNRGIPKRQLWLRPEPPVRDIRQEYDVVDTAVVQEDGYQDAQVNFHPVGVRQRRKVFPYTTHLIDASQLISHSYAFSDRQTDLPKFV